MGIRESLEKASMSGVPEWLTQESVGREGGKIRDEWSRLGAKPGADLGTRRLAAGMLQLRSQRPTRPLLGRANARALRWAESAVNRCELARQLRVSGPSLSIFHKAVLFGSGLAWRSVAVVLIFAAKTGMLGAMDGLVRTVDKLGKLHSDRHIGPMI